MEGDTVDFVGLKDPLVSSELVVELFKRKDVDEHSTCLSCFGDCVLVGLVVKKVLGPTKLSSRDAVMRSLVLAGLLLH